MCICTEIFKKINMWAMGKVKAPLFRVMPIKLSKTLLLPITRSNIATIEVHIKNGQGEPISFHSGTAAWCYSSGKRKPWSIHHLQDTNTDMFFVYSNFVV